MGPRLGVLVLVLAGGAFAAAAAGSGTPGPANALVDCEEAVRQRLLAPAAADFDPDGLRAVEDLGEGRYRLRSWVDAPNPYGVVVRRPYACTVSYPDPEHLRIESLTGV